MTAIPIPRWRALGLHWHAYQQPGTGPVDPAAQRDARLATGSGVPLGSPRETGSWLAARAVDLDGTVYVWNRHALRWEALCSVGRSAEIRGEVAYRAMRGWSVYADARSKWGHHAFALEAVTRADCPGPPPQPDPRLGATRHRVHSVLSGMRCLAKLVGTGMILVAATACAGQDTVTSQPAAASSTAAPSESVLPGSPELRPSGPVATPPPKPKLEVPEGSTPVPPKQIDAAALPADFPKAVYTGNGGTVLSIKAVEGGCGHAIGEASVQNGQQVVVNLTEKKGQTGQMCTMDIRYPVVSVTLAAPLGERTVVLKNTVEK
ncbi:hypothetical protein [Amycolatopsis sp. H20-H5]|uniref:hypothetical protein n=1 Tax=Amycolatopsis sp. H20-H5 TaxID=3046309 RepID=UPI002DB8C346|nr:hypothetical protein [Amycolatopsis sp. H20-H5]MEC3974773.1 hypothetical protein [Amycolatopsis sp. H20-H5]